MRSRSPGREHRLAQAQRGAWSWDEHYAASWHSRYLYQSIHRCVVRSERTARHGDGACPCFSTSNTGSECLGAALAFAGCYGVESIDVHASTEASFALSFGASNRARRRGLVRMALDEVWAATLRRDRSRRTDLCSSACSSRWRSFLYTRSCLVQVRASIHE